MPSFLSFFLSTISKKSERHKLKSLIQEYQNLDQSVTKPTAPRTYFSSLSAYFNSRKKEKLKKKILNIKIEDLNSSTSRENEILETEQLVTYMGILSEGNKKGVVKAFEYMAIADQKWTKNGVFHKWLNRNSSPPNVTIDDISIDHISKFYRQDITVEEIDLFGASIETIEGFNDFEHLSQITLPARLTKIGESAFKGCTKLKSVKLPSGVIEIGESAFEGCEKLESVKLPSGVTEIGKSAFGGCEKLESIDLPNGLTKIAPFAFLACTKLKSVKLPDRLTEIGVRTFAGCKNLNITNWPNGLTKIAPFAFLGCEKLTEIRLPDSFEELDFCAFESCWGLRSITFSGRLTNIGENTFNGCDNLRSITFPEELKLKNLPRYAFCGINGIETITLPDSLEKLGEHVFSACKNLQSITLPARLTKIDESAFNGCSSLKSIEFNEGLTKIGESAFTGCNSLEIVKFPSRLKEIDESAFNGCSSLKSIEFNEGLTKIGKSAFEGCYHIKSIKLPNSLTQIGKRAFTGLGWVDEVFVPLSFMFEDDDYWYSRGIDPKKVRCNDTAKEYLPVLGQLKDRIKNSALNVKLAKKEVTAHLEKIIAVHQSGSSDAEALKICLQGIVDHGGKVEKQTTDIKTRLESYYHPSEKKKDQHSNQIKR